METDLTPAALGALRKILHAAEVDTRRVSEATGIPPSQILVLREIGRHSGVTPSAIASVLRYGQATITNIVDRLVAAQLATRRRGEQDKRQVILEITEAGREKLRASPYPLQLRFSEAYARLSAWEQAMILAALQRIDTLIEGNESEARTP